MCGFCCIGWGYVAFRWAIAATNGIALGSGASLVGGGSVNAKIAAAFGSTIQAGGDLTLGDSTSYVGFTSDGELYTNSYTVTINDRNMAGLGSLTRLGNVFGQGRLTAGNARSTDNYAHFLLEQGKNLVGRGEVNGTFKNQGDVIGDGTGANERIVFNSPWVVSGKGTFTNTVRSPPVKARRSATAPTRRSPAPFRSSSAEPRRGRATTITTRLTTGEKSRYSIRLP